MDVVYITLGQPHLKVWGNFFHDFSQEWENPRVKKIGHIIMTSMSDVMSGVMFLFEAARCFAFVLYNTIFCNIVILVNNSWQEL